MKNFYKQQKANTAYAVLLLFAFFAIVGRVNAQTTIWTENFQGGAIPAGWTTANLGLGNNWAFNANAGYNSDGTPNGHMRISSNTLFGSDGWLLTPGISMTAGYSYKIAFKVRTSGAAIGLEVRAGSGTASTANYPTVLYTGSPNSTTFSTVTSSNVTCLVTGTYKFAFRGTPGGSLLTTNVLGIDNVIATENAPTPMAFNSCTVVQASTAAVDRGSSDNAILNLQVVTTGVSSPITCSSITFNTTGTTAPANLTNAKLYYTTTNTFSTATLFGTVQANPNGSYTVTPGTATTLASGTNYFWLAYDIAANATIGNLVDGQITSCTVGGTVRTPTATDPAGTRTILNDGPCGAVALTPNLTCTNVTQTNTGSATSSGITLSSCGGAAGDVWYSFTPSTTSSYTVTVARLGAYDPVLQAFSSTGTCPSLTLTNISCSDALSAATPEVITFAATSGVTYYFRVTDYNSVTQADGFTICLTQPPPNDVCSGATTLTINGSAVAGSNATASAESPLPTTTGCGSFAPTATSKGLWYTFTTTCAGNYTVSAVPTGSFDVEMAAFTGACGSTVGAGCGVAQGASGTESITITGAPANTVYRVLVWGYNAATGSFNVSVTGPPTSLSLSNGGTPAAGTIPAGAASQLLHAFTLTPACGATTYNLTSVTVNNSGTATASDFSTNAKLYYDADNSGTVNGGDLLITSTPVSSVLTFSISTQTGISGTRQYIIIADVATSAVGGNTFVASSTAATANITVNAGTTNGNTRTITPYNDNCAGAFSFGTLSTAGCTSQNVVTSGATQTFAGCVGTADDDVWFTFAMPAGYTSIAYSNINISGNTDRVLQFYSGTCGSLTPISPTSCFDPESGTVSGFTGGQTYYVRAYTSANAVNSSFTLCLTVPPANDNCAGVVAFPTLAPGCTNVNGNTLGATNSGVATCSGTADDDVWYSFVMPAGYTSVAYSFTNISGDNNRVIQFFNSSCGVGSFSCQTTATGSLSGLTPGSTYWLRVYTAAASPAYSEFTLCLALPPTNDDCAGALPIPSSGALQPGCNTVTASTAASTATTGVTPVPCSGTADDDVWYKFVISSTTNVGYSITDISGNNDRVIQVFNACGGSEVYCNTAEAGLLGSLTAGTYYVRVFTAGTGVNSDFNLCISLPPANDAPCNAIALSSPDDACLPTAGTTQLASASQGTNGVPAACNGTAEDDVWYSFVATSPTHTVTVTGSSGFNAAFELYTRSGSCPSATFTAVASSCTNNIATLGSVEALTIRGLVIGTTYFVRVYDAGATAPATPGFTICVVENPTGIPITYYDFELNSNRNGFFETSPEVSVNTAAAFTSPGTISGYAGAALSQGIAGVTIDGSCVSVTPASAGSLTLAPSNYIEVSLNAAGFQTLSLDFDFQSNWSQFLDLDYPWVAVNLSTDGGTTWSNLADFQVTSASTDIWLFPQYPLILPASCNNNSNIKVRFYGYNSFASSGRIYIDNVTLLAASTVANAGSKTLVNFSTVYTGVTSGLTGSLFVYDKFTANGTGSTVNLLNGNILLSNQLNVTNSGTFNFGVAGTPRYMLGNTLGTAAFNVNTSGTVGVTDVVGITATGGTFGNVQCLGTRTYGTDGSYTYFANAAQVTGNGLPSTVKNLTIDNAAGVTLTGAGVTINGILGLNNGILKTATFATDNVSITNTGSVSLTNGWVYGNLQKYVATGSAVIRNFEVGTLSNYTPALITFPSVTTAGNYTARANPTTFFTGSCLTTSKYLNQVWNLANNSVLPNNYNLILDWNTAGNLVGSPTPANLIVGNYNGSTWSYPTLAVTPNSTTLSVTGVTGSGLFQVAEGKTPTVTIAQSPTGAQCVGTPITFTATPTNGGASPIYEFKVNGVQVQNTTANTYTTSTLANGNIVTVTITSNDNCVIFNNSADAPTPITVTINPKPSLSVSNPAAVCAPGTVNITTAATDLNGIPGSTFAYYNDSTSAVNQTGALTTPQASAIAVNGVYWVRCTTPAGCFEVRPVTATINNCTTLTWEGGFGGVGQENNWNVATNWDPDFVPTINNDIVIPNRPFDPVLSSGAMGICKNVSVTGGAPISIAAGYTLDVKGNWTGTTATIVSGAGKTIFSGTSAQTITGGGTFSTLQINNGNGVTIANGGNFVNVTKALELKAGVLTTNGNLKTKSTSSAATAYIDDFSSGFTGSVSGIAYVERFIPVSPNGFRYVGQPVNTGTGVMSISAMEGFNVTGTPGQTIPLPTCSPTFTPINVASNSPYGNLMYYQENGPFGSPACRQRGWWFQIANDLTVGRGYGIKQGGNTVITFKGNVNSGTVTAANASTYTNVWSQPGDNGWNLVSNPFPSAITLDNTDGLSQSSDNPATSDNMPYGYTYALQFYITGNSTQTGSYVVRNVLTQPTDIALGQGFWVRVDPAIGTSATWKLGKGHRITSAPTYYNLSPVIESHLNVKVLGNNMEDVSDIYFIGTADNGMDLYDGNKWESATGHPTLYTKAGSEVMGINSLPSLTETKVVPMGLKPGTNGNYTFTFEDIASFPQTAMIYLEDLKLGTMNNLRANNTYVFNANLNDSPDRFMLHFQPGLQAEVADQDCDSEGSIELTQPAPTVWSTYEVKGNDNNVYATGTNLTGTVTVNNLPAQEYVVTVTHPSGYSAQEYITVNGSNPISASINASSTLVMVDEMVTLTANATNANEYVWNFGDGNTQTGSANVVHAYDAEGTYNVTLTASNSDCNSEATKIIKVNNTATGINGTAASNLNIYGQGERVVIEFNKWGGDKADIFMYNTLGQRMESLTGVSTLKGRQELYIADIKPGYYFIQVVSNGQVLGKKVFLGKQ